jgi:hypothetical protein
MVTRPLDGYRYGTPFRIFVVLVLMIPSPLWPVEREGLRLLVNVDQDTYRPGEPVIVEVSWTNMTNHTMTINDWRGPTDRSSPRFGSNEPPDFSVFYGNDPLDYRGPIICSTWASPPTVSLLPGQGVIKMFDVIRSGRAL